MQGSTDAFGWSLDGASSAAYGDIQIRFIEPEDGQMAVSLLTRWAETVEGATPGLPISVDAFDEDDTSGHLWSAPREIETIATVGDGAKSFRARVRLRFTTPAEADAYRRTLLQSGSVGGRLVSHRP